MRALHWLKKTLLTPLGQRMSKEQINESRGVALILVMISVAVISSLVVDLRYNQEVHFKLAIRTRDSIRAEALAAGGLNWSRLFLVMQSQLQKILDSANQKELAVPVQTVWQVPISSSMLQGFIDGSIAKTMGLEVGSADSDDQDPSSGALGTNLGFGDFDGSFTVEIVDEESKISLDFGWPDSNAQSTGDPNKRETTRRLLSALISPSRYDDLFLGLDDLQSGVDRASLVANMNDWVDPNSTRTNPNDPRLVWGRDGTGSEDDVYRSDDGIKPKNANFDSLGELRLVHGVGEQFERAFFDALTVYTPGGKVNIKSASDQVLEAIMRYCAINDNEPLFDQLNFADEMLRKWKEESLKSTLSVEKFTQFLQAQGLNIDEKKCKDVLEETSKVFTLKCKATVANVTRTLTLVTRVVDNKEDKYYFRSH